MQQPSSYFSTPQVFVPKFYGNKTAADPFHISYRLASKSAIVANNALTADDAAVQVAEFPQIKEHLAEEWEQAPLGWQKMYLLLARHVIEVVGFQDDTGIRVTDFFHLLSFFNGDMALELIRETMDSVTGRDFDEEAKKNLRML